MGNSVVDISQFSKKVKKILIPLLIIVAIIIIGKFRPWVIIDTGHVGVKLWLGKVQGEPLQEGPHLIIPYFNNVKIMDIRKQKKQVDAKAASKDLQETHSKIALNYHLLGDKAHTVYKTIGMDYEYKIIDPQVQEVVKSVTAQYEIEEMITQREQVSNRIKAMLKNRLVKNYIAVDALSIVDFTYSAQYRQSIEEKQIAEQRKLKAVRDLERIEIEAKQKVTQAKAEAEALRLQKENISPDLIELRRIEASIMAIGKWDGKLPSITSGAIPFIDAKSLKE